MKVLLNTCLLFALLHAVASLTCYQCFRQEEACDNPTEIECAEDEDACLSISGKISMNNFNLMTAYAKSCVRSEHFHPGTYFAATEHNLTIAANSEVCNTNKCNDKNAALSHRNALEENGRKCQACISFESDRCESENTVSCRGNETQCIYMGATIEALEDTDIALAIQGCGTPNFCKTLQGDTDVAGGLIIWDVTQLECTDAPTSPPALEGYTKGPHFLWSLPFMRKKQRVRDLGIKTSSI